MSQKYEKELKLILEGDKAAIEHVSATCSQDEKAMYKRIINLPFLVLQSPGSFKVDLLAVRPDISFPIEEKTSKHDRIVLTNNIENRRQLINYTELCSNIGLIPLYAYRKLNVKGDSWRLFVVVRGDLNIRGRMSTLCSALPKVTANDSGNYILKWNEGIPLHKFIDYVC